jgi:hypothetical protein
MLFAMVLFNITIQAQNINSNKLRWISNQTENLKNNERYSFSCSFVTDGSKILWIQKNGERVTEYTITNTDGVWSDIAQSGIVTYTVNNNELEGIIIFEKTDHSTMVTLDFSRQGVHAIRQRFYILQVELEN